MSAMNLNIELNAPVARVSYAKKVVLGAGCALLVAGSAWRQTTSATLSFVAEAKAETDAKVKKFAAIQKKFKDEMTEATKLDECSNVKNEATANTCLVAIKKKVVAALADIEKGTDFAAFKELDKIVREQVDDLVKNDALLKKATEAKVTDLREALKKELEKVDKTKVSYSGVEFKKLCERDDKDKNKYKIKEVEKVRTDCEKPDAKKDGNCDTALGKMLELAEDDNFSLAKKYGLSVKGETAKREVDECAAELAAMAANGMGKNADIVKAWGVGSSSSMLLIIAAGVIGVAAIGVGIYIFKKKK